ncbi:MAG: hypothetical protein ACI4SG_00580 [Oligosphaeraceae bacterium]
MALYRFLSLMMGCMALVTGGFCFWGLPAHPAWARSLPRWRWPGLGLGVLLLAYSAYEASAMLPDTRWPPLFWALVPVTVALAWKYLDFLFARAMGGLWIVWANFLIQHAFAYHCGLRPLYGLVALLWGCAGMAFLAWPWWMRDALETCANTPSWRRGVLVFAILSFAIFVLLPFLGGD